MALPVLLDIFASVILPVATSTLTTQMPLPVRLRRFASYGYSGKGALIAIDCATDKDIGTGSDTPPLRIPPEAAASFSVEVSLPVRSPVKTLPERLVAQPDAVTAPLSTPSLEE